MAELGFDFDPSTVEADTRNFDPLPNGQYEAEIIDSSVEDARSGKGRKLALTWKITAGPFENRQLWQNINILHDSVQAQEIGQKQLKSICDAIGVPAVRNTDDLHFKPALLVVGRQKDRPEYNEVKQVKPLGGGSPRPLAQTQSQQPRPTASSASQPRAAGAGGAPWRK